MTIARQFRETIHPSRLRLMVTGGAGFIGSAVIRHLLSETDHTVLNLDKLTYAGNLESLPLAAGNPRYQFVHGDIADTALVSRVFATFQPDIVMNLAAESHVDRSIDGPADFIQTNIVGTYALLEGARSYWNSLPGERKAGFRFHHVSSDEVFGSLGDDGRFTEGTPYDPSSPYSASKASSDHLVRAWHRTYGLPVIVTNCSNNYGPCQFPEKLIPLMLLNALDGKPLPIYGDGLQVRDWLYVEDHVRALCLVASQGRIGETYNIGAHQERTNLEVVRSLCALLDELQPIRIGAGSSHLDLITFVADRPGHDRRYAIDSTKIRRELGWTPGESFESGLRRTVEWYLRNRTWCSRIMDGNYRRERLGLAGEARERT